MKKCVRCNNVKSFNEFNKAKNNKDGYYSYCRDCGSNAARSWKALNRKQYKKQQQKWAKNNKEKVNNIANNYYQKKLKFQQYGITKDQYDSLLKSQSNGCKICGNNNENNRALAIDHCHKTGKIRGLLCGNCNRGLGQFKDNKELLSKAIKYLSIADDMID